MQHIDSTGNTLWPKNGIRVTNDGFIGDASPGVCGDGSNGVIISWNAYTDTSLHLLAQRFNYNGIPQWSINGVELCTAPGFRYGGLPVADGNAGAIFLFIDTRNDPHGTDYHYFYNDSMINQDLYAQHLNANGERLWTDTGKAVCNAPKNQSEYAYSISDGNGGAIFVFDDERNGNTDIYTQKLNYNGVAQWAVNGVPLTIAAGGQTLKSIVSDGAGGVVSAWTSAGSVYTQKINSSGNAVWISNGIAVSAGSNPQVAADSSGNFIYAFRRLTNGQTNLFAQKLNSSGLPQWAITNITVSNNSARGILENNPVVLSDNGSVIVGWVSAPYSLLTGLNAYASKILSTGVIAGSSSNSFISIANGNWNDPATWAGGVVPSATSQVNLRHAVTITADATCKFLIVEQPYGNIRVKTGVNFKVTN